MKFPAAVAIALTILGLAPLHAQSQLRELGGRLPGIQDQTVSIRATDVDLDGDLDLFVGNRSQLGSNRSFLLLNDGNGFFTDVTAARLPKSFKGGSDLVLGDVDGDGDPDLVQARDFDLVRLYINDGKGNFVDVTATRMPKAPVRRNMRLAFGDLDGDGDLDLVLGVSSWQNEVYLNVKGTFVLPKVWRFPVLRDGTLAVVVADFDGDGDLDVFFGNRGQDRLYLNDGKAFFRDVTSTHLPASASGWTSAVAFGDVDGDGDPDLVLGSFGQTRLYLNDGRGKFQDVTSTHMPVDSDGTEAIALADLDEDGDLDLVVGNWGHWVSHSKAVADPSKLYLNDGKGRFRDMTSTRGPLTFGGTRAVLCADLDGDLDLDLVLGNAGGMPFVFTAPYQNQLFTNLHRQIDARTDPAIGKPYRLEVYALPGYSRASQAAVPIVGLLPLNPRFRIPPFGWLGLHPSGSIILPPLSIAAPIGRTTIDIPLPNLPILRGLTLYAQFLVIHTPAVTDWRLSNVVSRRIR